MIGALHCTKCTLARGASVHDSMANGRAKSLHMWHPFEHNPLDAAKHRSKRTASYARVEHRGFEEGWRVARDAAAHIAQRAGAGEIASEIMRLLAMSDPVEQVAAVLDLEPTACGRSRSENSDRARHRAETTMETVMEETQKVLEDVVRERELEVRAAARGPIELREALEINPAFVSCIACPACGSGVKQAPK